MRRQSAMKVLIPNVPLTRSQETSAIGAPSTPKDSIQVNLRLLAICNDLVEARNSGADVASSVRRNLSLKAVSLILGSMIPAIGLVTFEQILKSGTLRLRGPLVHRTYALANSSF